MSDREQEIEHLEKLRAIHQGNIRDFEKRLASYAPLDRPMDLVHSLELEQKQLQQVEARLKNLQEGKSEQPTSPRGIPVREILIGLFVAVVGGIIVAWFIKEGARFAPTPTPIPTSSPASIVLTHPPAVRPTDTLTICDSNSYYEENDNRSQACELLPGQTYVALPDDEEDVYYFVLTQTTSVNVRVTNYHPLDPSGQGGQLLIYDESDNTGSIAREPYLQGTVELPSKDCPDCLTNLDPGKYYVRIYTYPGTFNSETPYQLTITYEPDVFAK